MASGIFMILDDIGALMDDVASMSKIATKKTAGILGDDLAVNAEKATGFVSSRELPVLWAITKGSAINKIIILPIAFLLSYFWPIAITVVLVLGGLFLAFEGAHKIYEYLFENKREHNIELATNLTPEEIIDKEKNKIKSAIRTDFILSIEIIIIALGAVLESSITIQILVVSVVALIATIGVYGIVALIVRMDDAGYKLMRYSPNKVAQTIGKVLVNALPWIIKTLAVVGTLALLLVSGGIFVHNIDYLHHFLDVLPSLLQEFIIGLSVGLAVLFIYKFSLLIYHRLVATP